MSMFLSYFYIKHIIRKDLINKLNLVTVYNIPSFSNIVLNFKTNQKKVKINDTCIYNWIVMLEYLAGTVVLFKKQDEVLLDYFNRLVNFRFFSVIENKDLFFSFFFFNIHFIWFRSLLFVKENIEKYNKKLYQNKKNSFKKKVSRKEIMEVKTDISYFEYVAPEISADYLNRFSFKFSIGFMDLSFLNFIPINSVENKIKLCVNFDLNTKKKALFPVILSAYKCMHRIYVEKKN